MSNRNVTALPPKWTKQFNSFAEAPLFLSVEEASILWRIPQKTVRQLCSEGTMCAAKFGKSWRIDKEQTNKKLFNYN